MLKTLGCMAAGGGVGWCVGFVLMMLKADMELPNAMAAAMWPVGGAFVGVVGGALVAQAI